MKKWILPIWIAALFIAFIFCAQITVKHDLQFTAKAVDCASYDWPPTEDDYAEMEKLDISFDAHFSKRIFGSAKMEGTVSYGEKTYYITNCLPADQGYMVAIQDVKKPGEPGELLMFDADLAHFYFMNGNHKYGPADSYEMMLESLNAFGMLSQSEKANDS